MDTAAITLMVQQITPYLQQYGPLFAAKAVESLGEKVPAAVSQLWQGIQARFDTEAVAKGALEKMLADPENETVKTVVEYHLAEYLKNDAAFAERIGALLKEAQTAAPAATSYHAVATGGSAVAQGENATAVAAGGISIGGSVSGSTIVTGNRNEVSR